MEPRSRQPRGVPTGGRFAAQSHAEADITLVDDHAISASEARRLANMWCTSVDATIDFALYGKVTEDGVAAWKTNRATAAATVHPFTPTAVEEIDRVISYMEGHLSRQTDDGTSASPDAPNDGRTWF